LEALIALEKTKKGFTTKGRKIDIHKTDDGFGTTKMGIHLVDGIFVLETNIFATLLEFGDNGTKFFLGEWTGFLDRHLEITNKSEFLKGVAI
jgi:hypothetical protein